MDRISELICQRKDSTELRQSKCFLMLGENNVGTPRPLLYFYSIFTPSELSPLVQKSGVLPTETQLQFLTFSVIFFDCVCLKFVANV